MIFANDLIVLKVAATCLKHIVIIQSHERQLYVKFLLLHDTLVTPNGVIKMQYDAP